jgi:hypothetical protein
MTVENELVRSILIPEVIRIISRYYAMSPHETFRWFYESNTEAALADETTGLYGQSPLCIAGMFIEEKDGRGNVDLDRLGS